METTRNELTPYSKHFFNNLGNYLDTKIYFFGSIQRRDYFPRSSDIDVDIFTDNESSTIMKIQNLLSIDRRDVHKFIYMLPNCNRLVRGTKIQHVDKENNFSTEILVFNDIYKDDVTREHNSKIILPFHISWLLVLLKYVFYDLELISKKMYASLKRRLLNGSNSNTEFIVVSS